MRRALPVSLVSLVSLVEPFALCLMIVGKPPGIVCGAVSSAGRFWLARLLSSGLGGGAGAMGKVAGGSRGRVERVSEEHPSTSGLGWACTEWLSGGRRVGMSVGGGKCGVLKSSFRLADCA